MEKKDIKILLERASKGELTVEEENQVKLWLLKLNQDQATDLKLEQIQSASEAIWERLGIKSKNKKIQLLKPILTAVASIILIMLFSLLFYNKNINQNTAVQIEVNQIAPGTNGGTLTLSDGTVVEINDTLKGDIASELGTVIFRDEEGQIIYNITDQKQRDISLNLLSTKRGQQIKVRLPDQSVVTLNASSTLKYPTSFLGSSDRTVFLSGEGYFEVAKNSKQPFIVMLEDQRVEVLGTKFNINSYNPKLLITTLEEGSINVFTVKDNLVIRPGQQTINNGASLEVKNVDLEEVLGWKDGNFVFVGTSIQSIMTQLANWYNVEVIYEGSIPSSPIYANISRYRTLNNVLQILENASGIKFEIKERRVYVKQ